MPIRPSEKARYPKDWPAISREVRERAQDQCECVAECGLHPWGRCVERQGRKAFFAKGKIVLTVAHLNHTPEDCRDENLRAMCQRCHNRYDMPMRKVHAAETRAVKKGPLLPRMGNCK